MQQLESSRLKLTQLEQELQRARQQVWYSFFSGLFRFYFIHVTSIMNNMDYITRLLCYFLFFRQGIFISSSGDQTHAMGGNGNFFLHYSLI